MSAEAIEGFVVVDEEAEVVQLFSGEETAEEKLLSLENKLRRLREKAGRLSCQLSDIQTQHLACITAIISGDQELRSMGGDPEVIKREYLSKVSPTSAIAGYGRGYDD